MMEAAKQESSEHQKETHLQSEGAVPEDTESQEESQILNENLKCRFYRKDFPEENDIVIVSTSFPFQPLFVVHFLNH
jgi:hypothetical protein